MTAAVPPPPTEADIQRAAAERAAIDSSTRLPVLTFYAAAVFWLLTGTVFALVASIKMHAPEFLADFNRRFAHRPREMQTAWRPAPENLDRICCFVHQRVVSHDNIVQWEGQRFQIPQQGRRFSFAGAKVHLYQALDGRISLYYGDIRLQHTLASPG